MTTNPPACDQGGDGAQITCQACVDFIIDYLEGTLTPEEKTRFQAHLDACRNCVTYLENYNRTVKLCKHSCECHDPNPPVPEKLVQGILKARMHKH